VSTIPKNTALTSLRKLVEKAASIKPNSPEQWGWENGAKTAVIRIFGKQSPQFLEFSRWTTLGTKRSVLESFIAEIEDFWEDDEVTKQAANTLVAQPAEGNKIEAPEQTGGKSCVFIGHGRSLLWARLQVFLENRLGVKTVNYESAPRVGDSIVPILEEMLDQATFAVLILTAEDETASGAKRARQNVIHEAGLFQGRLGFRKAILLIQEGAEDFSNVAGLQYISFTDDKIEQSFWELQEVLKREGQL